MGELSSAASWWVGWTGTARTATTLRSALFGGHRGHLFPFEASAAIDVELVEALAGTAHLSLRESPVSVLIESGHYGGSRALLLPTTGLATAFFFPLGLGWTGFFLRDTAILVCIKLSEGVAGGRYFLRGQDAVFISIKHLHHGRNRRRRWSGGRLGAILAEGGAGSEGDEEDC